MVIDLAAEVSANRKYLYDIMHFSDAGSRYAAGIIKAPLQPLVVK